MENYRQIASIEHPKKKNNVELIHSTIDWPEVKASLVNNNLRRFTGLGHSHVCFNVNHYTFACQCIKQVKKGACLDVTHPKKVLRPVWNEQSSCTWRPRITSRVSKQQIKPGIELIVIFFIQAHCHGNRITMQLLFLFIVKYTWSEKGAVPHAEITAKIWPKHPHPRTPQTQ